MKLYYHPVSAYSQKVVMAFHEKEVSFEPQIVDLMDPQAREAYLKVNPFGKIPVLVLPEQERIIPESSIIIEYLDTHFDSGNRLIPEDKNLARQARYFDRTADLYLNDPMQKIFFDSRKPEPERDPKGVAAAKKTLDIAYGLMERGFAKRHWAIGEDFTMAECAYAPALNYLRMVYPFDKYENVVAYANRLTERPSFKKVWDEAQPFLAKMS